MNNVDNFAPIRGFKDNLDENYHYSKVYQTCVNIAKSNNYIEILSPILEKSSLFERNLGEESDINLKELYKFDFYNESLALRPEFTAGIARFVCSMKSFVSGHSFKNGLGLFSFGPVFRHDRPQAGRYRQFYQGNFEFFKDSSLICDVSSILLGCSVLQSLIDESKGEKKFIIELNSLGSKNSKKNYEDKLREYFEKYKNDLSDESKLRLVKNPIRILDSKEQSDKNLLLQAPKINQVLTNEETDRIQTIAQTLSSILPQNIFQISLDQTLVRGLDYYTSTVFEIKPIDITTNKAGLTIFAGGRYDSLIEQISGGLYNIPAFGFAFGVERLIEFFNIDESKLINKADMIFNLVNKSSDFDCGLKAVNLKCAIITLEVDGGDCVNQTVFCIEIFNKLKSLGLVANISKIKKSISKTIQDLDGDGYDCVIFIGKSELETKKVKIKLISKEFDELDKGSIENKISSLIFT